MDGTRDWQPDAEAEKVTANLKGDAAQIAAYLIQRCGDFIYDRERATLIAAFLRVAGPGAPPRPANLGVAQDALVAAVDHLIEAERLYDMAEGEHAIEDAERDIESRDKPIIEAARCYVSTLRAAPVAHRCSGCNHRWQDLPGAELCGDCWRKVQPKLDWMENTTGRAAPVEAPQPRPQKPWCEHCGRETAVTCDDCYEALRIPAVAVVAAGPPDALHALVKKWRAHAADLDRQAGQLMRADKVSEGSQTRLVAHAMRRDANDLEAVLRASPAPNVVRKPTDIPSDFHGGEQ